MSPRPADEARRALREARSRAAQDSHTAPSPGGESTGRETPRPGDAAREALRRAVSEQRGSGRGDDDPPGEEPAARDTGAGQDTGTGQDTGAAGSGTEPEAFTGPQESPAGTDPAHATAAAAEEERTPSAEADRPGPRAADVAREALRAAREDARRAREETEREGARRRRRARQKAVDDRAAAVRRARDHGTGEAADVRRLLSDAFRMPDLPDEPEGASSDRAERAGQDRTPSRVTELLHGHAGREPEPEPEPEPEDVASWSSPAAPRAARNGAADAEPAPTPPAAPLHAPGTGAPAAPVTTPARPPEAGPSATPAPEQRDPSVTPASEKGQAPASDTPAPPASSPHAPSATVHLAPPPPVTPDPTPPPTHATPRTAAGANPRTTPRSMAAPNRDNDLRRTFPAFPAREGDRFAESWWGNAWVSALEQGALDVNRLERGRGYAEQGHVDAITVTPGLVLAYVQGSRPRPYRVQVRLRTLDDSDWDRFLDAAADRPGDIAALLDKEMPPSLAHGGVPLLPGPGDLEPRCSCPDRGHPCKHAAALCYQTARLLDADPFVLLLLRGRGERELLDALSRLSATRAARAAQDKEPAPLPGVRAKEALQPRALPPLPAPLPPPAHPEQPPAYPASPGGPDPFALDQLATDAAARAHALLTTGRDPVGQLTFWQDAVRLAAARPGSGLTAGTRALYSSLATAAGRTPADLARAVAAWRQGGLEGLAVLEEPWDPPAGRFDRARPLLLAADLPAFRPWRNHLTHPHGHLQLRLGRDGLWYAYESEPGRDDWWPRGTPDLDPVGALTGLGLTDDL
ncbi:SWIM zinc finger family protein [Streptomyces sp. NPDC094143]|uniref:SWIM zinc finger family protein n=1 Tax=Streptomyces sp. NPDC094143 TaxID=3155310 RepID=UPI003325C3BB